MAVTKIDLDDEVLAEIMRIAGVHTEEEAVNLAMRAYVERFSRVEALARSREHAKSWDYEGWRAARAVGKACKSSRNQNPINRRDSTLPLIP